MKKVLLFLTATLLLAAPSHRIYAQGKDFKEITIEDITNKGTFSSRSVYGLRSMNDGVHYTSSLGGRKIVMYSYKTGEVVDTIFNLDLMGEPPFERFSDYTFSPDEKLILFETAREPIYRRSYLAEYYIYDRKEISFLKLSAKGKQKLASFSPDGTKVVFVRDNDLFYFDLNTGEEQRVTTDGKHNEIINGTTDWVYEEEFAITRGYAWSPDSRYLAYYRFDESQVKQFNMTLYEHKLYPVNYTFKYPKAGEKNSVVEIWVYDLTTGKKVKMDVGKETDQYIPRIKWTQDPHTLAIVRENRLQNHIEILLADAATGTSHVIYSEKNKYYIEEIDDNYPVFLDNGKEFVIYSEQDGYRHFYLYDMEGNLINQITRGKWDVDEFLGIDNKKRQLYYTSSESSPLRRDVYVISLDGKKKKKLSNEEGTNTAVFSKGFKYYILYHSSVTTPPVITLHNAKGELIRTLEDNGDLREKVKEYGVGPKEFFTFTTSDGVELNGWMLKPPGFDPSKKYPVFFTVYGGPGSQTVRDLWSYGWNELLAQRGYIVVSVDNRGTGARGEAFRKITYGQLGKYETHDQIEAARYLGSLPYVDASRIGIFGWSYGGFMAASCLFKGHGVFRMAIAVAPVTNWRYYDSIYTERYMGLPRDNAKGYDENSPINFCDEMEGKFLLIHGTGDDNVHFQNSVELMEALIQAGKQFEVQIYPDKNHGIYGGNTRYHLYTRMTDFVLENL